MIHVTGIFYHRDLARHWRVLFAPVVSRVNRHMAFGLQHLPKNFVKGKKLHR